MNESPFRSSRNRSACSCALVAAEPAQSMFSTCLQGQPAQAPGSSPKRRNSRTNRFGSVEEQQMNPLQHAAIVVHAAVHCCNASMYVFPVPAGLDLPLFEHHPRPARLDEPWLAQVLSARG